MYPNILGRHACRLKRKKLLNPEIEELFMTRTGIEPMLQP